MEEYITTEEAQAEHEARQAEEPDHDLVGCWCCCLDCDFELDMVI